MKQLITLSLFSLVFCSCLSAFGQSSMMKLQQPQIDSLRFLGKNAFDCNSVVWRIVRRKKDVIPLLIERIGDTTITSATNTCKTSHLRVGDLAYLTLCEIITLPLFDITKKQFDVFDISGCQAGVYEYIETNRQKFSEQVKTWYKNNEKSIRWINYKKSDLLTLPKCIRINKIEGYYELFEH